MNCPKCGKPEQARVKVCPGCGEAYACEDLQFMAQVEFLLAETAEWEGVELLRLPYVKQLTKLKSRLVRSEPPEKKAVLQTPAAPAVPVASEAAPAIPVIKTPPKETSPKPLVAPPPQEKTAAPPQPAQKVPFDEWLLSDRNIKIALYGGGLLLFIAGIIFVGINWARLPGPVKFAVTLLVTGFTLLGGYLLHRRPAYRLGGIALLGLACGFMTLNFAVLQIYVLGPEGLRDDVMWLIASPLCLIAYFLIGYWSRHELFACASIAALGSLTAAALTVANAELLVAALVSAIFLLAMLALGLLVQNSSLADFTYRPLFFTAQGLMPLALLFSLVHWLIDSSCVQCVDGSPWLAVSSIAVGVIFYAVTHLKFKWLWSRWVVVALFSLTAVMSLWQADIDTTIAGLILMVLAMVELLAGYWVEKRVGQRSGALPFYVLAAVLALFVTLQAVTDKDAMIKVLFGDVALLALAAWVFQDYSWVFGAVWLFMAPIYLLIDTYVDEFAAQGLLLGLLGLNYVAAGYVLGRREMRLAWPFLTAAAFLSVVASALCWVEPWIFTASTTVFAVVYGLAAVWLGWSVLLLPALVALDLVVIGFDRAAFGITSPIDPALVISAGITGGALLLIGLAMRRKSLTEWSYVSYLIGAADLVLAYIGGLIVGDELAVGMSVAMATFLFVYAWLEQDLFTEMHLPPILTYLGTCVVLVGTFYVLDTLGGPGALEYWPAFTAGLCALYIVLAWLLRHDPMASIYGIPLRYAGLSLMGFPLVGAVITFDPLLGAVAFAIAGLALAFDTVVRRTLVIAYLAAGSFLIVLWFVLMGYEVSELLAYTTPLGVGLLIVGWIEHIQGRKDSYLLATIIGFGALMGSTLFQSVVRSDAYYAILLLIESLLAAAWGYYQKVRCYIQAAGLALALNAIVQLGPVFIELTRWIQIAITGGLLLGGGLLALFRREEILATKERLTDGWRQLEP